MIAIKHRIFHAATTTSQNAVTIDFHSHDSVSMKSEVLLVALCILQMLNKLKTKLKVEGHFPLELVLEGSLDNPYSILLVQRNIYTLNYIQVRKIQNGYWFSDYT